MSFGHNIFTHFIKPEDILYPKCPVAKFYPARLIKYTYTLYTRSLHLIALLKRSGNVLVAKIKINCFLIQFLSDMQTASLNNKYLCYFLARFQFSQGQFIRH
jgi:hypothetical protein